MSNTLTLSLNNLIFPQVGKCHRACFVPDSPPLLASLPLQPQLPLHRHTYKSLSCQLCAGTQSRSVLAPSLAAISSRGAAPHLAHILPLQAPRPPRCGRVRAWDKVLTNKIFLSKFPPMPKPLCTNTMVISVPLCRPYTTYACLRATLQRKKKKNKETKIKHL